ncbi:type II secretion system GspH family protein [Vibrio chagasii]|nr:type II secretion system GspH family protein [Vibrio chagasii]
MKRIEIQIFGGNNLQRYRLQELLMKQRGFTLIEMIVTIVVVVDWFSDPQVLLIVTHERLRRAQLIDKGVDCK